MAVIKVFKIGGNVVDKPEKLEKFAAEFAAVPGPKVLIHGGGAIASRMQKELGSEPIMVAGRRVTDEETLRIVTMVYAGWCNKHIVSLLQKNGCRAIGLSGTDGGAVTATKRPPVMIEGRLVDFGFVGDIAPEGVDTGLIHGLLAMGLTPVFCAITCDGKGSLLNTNADTVASSIAVALASENCKSSATMEATTTGGREADSVELIYCFEKDGVLMDRDDDGSLIPEITAADFARLKAEGVVADGMLPKLENSFRAIRDGVASVTIKNSENISNNRGTVLKP